MTLKSALFPSLFVWVIFCWSCKEEPECDLEIPYNVLSIGFYDNEGFQKEKVKFDLIIATGSDSILYTNEDSLDNFSFVLNPAATEVTYNFITGVRAKSITLSYTKQLVWLSEACGPNFFYDQLTIVSHTFDSAQLIQTGFDHSINENVRIYNN